MKIGSKAKILPRSKWSLLFLPSTTKRQGFLQFRLDANFREVVGIGHLCRHVEEEVLVIIHLKRSIGKTSITGEVFALEVSARNETVIGLSYKALNDGHPASP